MKDLSKIVQDIIPMCSICKSNDNILTSIEPCFHQFCLFCLDKWLENHMTCANCAEYITYINDGDKKLNINKWKDIKLNILRSTHSFIYRKLVLRNIIEKRYDLFKETMTSQRSCWICIFLSLKQRVSIKF